jgi:hypothetical protein
MTMVVMDPRVPASGTSPRNHGLVPSAEVNRALPPRVSGLLSFLEIVESLDHTSERGIAVNGRQS